MVEWGPRSESGHWGGRGLSLKLRKFENPLFSLRYNFPSTAEHRLRHRNCTMLCKTLAGGRPSSQEMVRRDLAPRHACRNQTRHEDGEALACVRRDVATDSRRRDALLQAATLERAQPRRRIALSRAFLRWRLKSVDPAVLASRVSAVSLLVVYIVMVGSVGLRSVAVCGFTLSRHI